MGNALPAVGTFIRPVGYFSRSYCLKVTHQPPSGLRIVGQRWGLQNKRPINDGHVGGEHCIDLTPVRPGTWKSPKHYFDEHGITYWVAMTEDERGQLSFLDTLDRSISNG